MKKELRLQIYNKYNGRCAYCGKKIEYKEMQVDHITPQNRVWAKSEDTNMKWYGVSSVDDINNLNPACRRCNHYKRSLDLEGFREAILTLNERLKKIYIVNVAIDFGLELKEFSGKFYFEKGSE